MPIRPENRERYPKNWAEISLRIRFERAKGYCEGLPGQPPCGAKHGKPHPETGSTVVLTVAHLDHTPENSDGMHSGGPLLPVDLSNLRALCQRCHLEWDVEVHALNRRVNSHLDKGSDLFPNELEAAYAQKRAQIRNGAIELIAELSNDDADEREDGGLIDETQNFRGKEVLVRYPDGLRRLLVWSVEGDRVVVCSPESYEQIIGKGKESAPKISFSRKDVLDVDTREPI